MVPTEEQESQAWLELLSKNSNTQMTVRSGSVLSFLNISTKSEAEDIFTSAAFCSTVNKAERTNHLLRVLPCCDVTFNAVLLTKEIERMLSYEQ